MGEPHSFDAGSPTTRRCGLPIDSGMGEPHSFDADLQPQDDVGCPLIVAWESHIHLMQALQSQKDVGIFISFSPWQLGKNKYTTLLLEGLLVPQATYLNSYFDKNMKLNFDIVHNQVSLLASQQASTYPQACTHNRN